MHDYRERNQRKNGDEDNSGSHRRGSDFVLVKFGKLRCLAHECFLTNLFSETILMEESDIWRYEDECEEERKEKVGQEKSQISHNQKLLFG